MLNLEVIPGEESNKTELSFTWECVAFKTNYMDFKMTFDHFRKVSMNNILDLMQISFFAKEYFSASDG